VEAETESREHDAVSFCVSVDAIGHYMLICVILVTQTELNRPPFLVL
jgi:hypothetical protein